MDNAVVLLNRRFARGLPRPRPCRGVLLGGRPDLAAVWLRGHAFTNAEGLVAACCYPWDHVMLPMGPGIGKRGERWHRQQLFLERKYSFRKHPLRK